MLRIAECYSLAGDFQKSIHWARIGYDRVSDSMKSINLRISCARSLRFLCEYEEALAELKFVRQNAKDEDERSRMHYESAINYALLFQSSYAIAEFDSVHSPPGLADRARDLRMYAEKQDDIPYRSGYVAGAFSLIPGLGYFYSGHSQTAFAAIAVVSLFAYASAKSFQAGHDGAGTVCLFGGISWYVGSIYGAVLSANRFNQFQRNKYSSNFTK